MLTITVLIICALFVIGLFSLNNFLNNLGSKSNLKTNIKSSPSSPSFTIDEDGTIIRDCKEEQSRGLRPGNNCYKCGSKLKIKTNFCPNCGAPLS